MPYQRRFNFRKADWISFPTDLENEICNITPNPKNYKLFTNLVQNIAQKHIARGCRTRYVPCLNKESLNMPDKYKTLCKEDPFAEDTITAGEQLMASMTQERQRKWLDTIESTNIVILLNASYLKKVYLQQYLQINANTLLAFNICTHLLLLSRKNVE